MPAALQEEETSAAAEEEAAAAGLVDTSGVWRSRVPLPLPLRLRLAYMTMARVRCFMLTRRSSLAEAPGGSSGSEGEAGVGVPVWSARAYWGWAKG